MIDERYEKQVVERVPRGLLIAGRWRPAAGGASFDVEDPSTATPLCSVADAGREDAFAALDAAVAVQRAWAATEGSGLDEDPGSGAQLDSGGSDHDGERLQGGAGGGRLGTG